MSQTKVTEFFVQRKRSLATGKSENKKIKVESDVITTKTITAPPQSANKIISNGEIQMVSIIKKATILAQDKAIPKSRSKNKKVKKSAAKSLKTNKIIIEQNSGSINNGLFTFKMTPKVESILSLDRNLESINNKCENILPGNNKEIPIIIDTTINKNLRSSKNSNPEQNETVLKRKNDDINQNKTEINVIKPISDLNSDEKIIEKCVVNSNVNVTTIMPPTNVKARIEIIKEKLGNCTSLSELKQRLADFGNAKSKLEQSRKQLTKMSKIKLNEQINSDLNVHETGSNLKNEIKTNAESHDIHISNFSHISNKNNKMEELNCKTVIEENNSNSKTPSKMIQLKNKTPAKQYATILASEVTSSTENKAKTKATPLKLGDRPLLYSNEISSLLSPRLTSPNKNYYPIQKLPPSAVKNLFNESPDKRNALLYTDREILTSPSKTIERIRAMESPSKIAAHDRFGYLVDGSTPGLSLPSHYKRLLDTFVCLDLVLSMLTNRKEICTYSKIKAGVEKMTKRSFELKNLGQIKSVYPEGYILRQEIGLPCFGEGRSQAYQLTLEANMVNNAQEMMSNNMSPTKAPTLFSASKLSQRKSTFHNNLLNIVKNDHKNFLSNLVPPMIVDAGRITRWHPKFELEKLPEVISAELPSAPSKSISERITSAQDILDFTSKNAIKMDFKILKALEIVSKRSSMLPAYVYDLSKTPIKYNNQSGTPVKNSDTITITSTKNDGQSEKHINNIDQLKTPTKNSNSQSQMTVKNVDQLLKTPVKNSDQSKAIDPPSYLDKSPIKGISKSLLDRIRAKELQSMEKSLTVSIEDQKKMAILERLPELARILRTYFMVQKRPAIPYQDAIKCICNSYKSSLSSIEADKHIKMMLELMPEWISSVKVSKGQFIKISADQDLNRVIEKISRIVK